MPLCHKQRGSPPSSEKVEEECVPCGGCLSDLSIIDSSSSGFAKQRSRTQIFETCKPPNIEHELNVAKSLLQQGSLYTGDNLFDHLAELIKRVLNVRPPNIVDYFEEFSYNVREQKYRVAERFAWATYEPVNLDTAKHFFKRMKLPYQTSDIKYDVCKQVKDTKKTNASSRLKRSMFSNHVEVDKRKLLLNENILRLHLYWVLCGFGILPDEMLHLANAIGKIQFHPTIQHARFWGKIYALKKPYYIVEASLTQSEIEKRMDQMREEMIEKMNVLRSNSDQNMMAEMAVDLIPGVHWQNRPEEDLNRMRIPTTSIPQVKNEIQFDIPPEAVGTGLNRRSYFVVNSLSDEWIELPIVTPEQIQISRKTKKLLTGDLEADICTYPSFPGTEKHYLRAIIARITSGTYIAPNGYYRRLTKRERMEALGEEVEEEGEDEFDGEEEEEELENDAIIIENSAYEPIHAELMTPKSWVHVRPNILEQGRVVYFDEEEARKALEKERLLRLRGEEETFREDEEGEDEIEEDVDEENEVIEEDDNAGPRSGPALFTECSEDHNTERVPAWTPRYSSPHNKINQLVIMRSNLWPGAYSFTFEKFSDSIYMGWGLKYVARNTTITHLPPIEDDYYPDEHKEVLDPTVEMEEAWTLYMKKRQQLLEEFIEEEAESASC